MAARAARSHSSRYAAGVDDSDSPLRRLAVQRDGRIDTRRMGDAAPQDQGAPHAPADVRARHRGGTGWTRCAVPSEWLRRRPRAGCRRTVVRFIRQQASSLRSINGGIAPRRRLDLVTTGTALERQNRLGTSNRQATSPWWPPASSATDRTSRDADEQPDQDTERRDEVTVP